MRKQLCLVMMLYTSWMIAAPLDKVVAIVNHDVITASELDAQVEVARQQLLARKIEEPPASVLRKQVLNHLIDEQIELQLAKNNDLSVDNAELDETISKIAASNHLSLEEMRAALEQQGTPFAKYRENIRKEMLINRVQQSAVGKEITVSMKQVNDYLKSSEHIASTPQTFHVQNIVVPLPEEPTTAQIAKAKQKAIEVIKKARAGADFSQLALSESSAHDALEGGDLGERHLAELPEIFAEQVVKMKIGDVKGPLRTGNGFQIIKLVGVSHTDVHHQVTKTHVRHILLKPGVNMTEAEADRQIRNLFEQLKSGKDFAAMAKQYSLDHASAAKGGDLGWVTADELVPSFAEAMNQLPLNVISKPVKTPFGWHLIQVLERKTVDDSDAYQRQQVRQFLYQRKFNEAVQNWQQHMRSSAYVQIIEKDLA
jgi:peptidyl-prolyl cis-trans isomerase SurA